MRDHVASLAFLLPVVKAFCPFAFGGEMVKTGPVDDSHKFAGMELDSEDGLYHTLYRQYSPSLGRWFSTDPVLR